MRARFPTTVASSAVGAGPRLRPGRSSAGGLDGLEPVRREPHRPSPSFGGRAETPAHRAALATLDLRRMATLEAIPCTPHERRRCHTVESVPVQTGGETVGSCHRPSKRRATSGTNAGLPGTKNVTAWRGRRVRARLGDAQDTCPRWCTDSGESAGCRDAAERGATARERRDAGERRSAAAMNDLEVRAHCSGERPSRWPQGRHSSEPLVFHVKHAAAFAGQAARGTVCDARS